MNGYVIKEFSAIAVNSGVVLCTKKEGMFLVIRSTEELQRLKDFLDKLVIV